MNILKTDTKLELKDFINLIMERIFSYRENNDIQDDDIAFLGFDIK